MLGGPGNGGPGGGGAGGGFEEAAYRRFLSGEIQQAIQSNSKIDRAFATADVSVHLSPSGRITLVRLRRSTGNEQVDRELVATIRNMPTLSEPPPASAKAPFEITVKGLRS